jgi:hypothetical protein
MMVMLTAVRVRVIITGKVARGTLVIDVCFSVRVEVRSTPVRVEVCVRPASASSGARAGEHKQYNRDDVP